MDDVGNTSATATALSNTTETILIGEITAEDTQDIDVFSIELEAGQTIEVLLPLDDPQATLGVGVIWLNGPTADSTLEPLDNETNELALSFGFPTDNQPQIVYTAVEAGTHYIYVSGYDPDDLGQYVLEVRPQTDISDLHGDQGALVTPISVNDTVDGTIHKVDDTDYFVLDLVEGQHVQIEVTPRGTDGLETMTVVAQPEAGLGVGTYRGTEYGDAIVSFTAEETGRYYVSVVGVAYGDSNTAATSDTGDYTLTVTELDEAPTSDLAVSDATITLLEGDGNMAEVTFTIVNNGPDTAHGVWADISTSGSVNDQGQIGLAVYLAGLGTFSLAAGESRTLTTVVELPGGVVETESVVVSAFDSNNAPEPDETDNTATFRTQVVDGMGYDDLSGVFTDSFILQADGTRDLIRNFEKGRDVIDVSALGVASFDQLEITEQRRADGSVAWIQIGVVGGPVEVALRFGDDTALEASSLDATDFVFADEAAEPVVTEILDTDGLDDLSGVGTDVFVMLDDDVRDVIRDVELGRDLIDVSAFATDFSELEITNQTRADGSVSWVQIGDAEGTVEIAVRFGDDTPLDAAALTADHFIFGDTAPAPDLVLDTTGYDDLTGGAGAQIFQLSDDGVRDLIRDFELGVDQIDVSAFASDFSELEITNQTRANGSTAWVQIADADGTVEVAVRFGDGTALDASALTADDFIFA